MESERFGRYQTIKPLGAGAMGAVFLARDELLAREVAIKTIHAMPMAGLAGEQFRARFLNEARAVASLAHPNVVRVFDLGFEGDTPFLVMEVIDGPSLKDRLDGGARLSASEVRTLGVQLARALQAAHALGILHRDLKPANVLDAGGGSWKLADFGVAHVPDSSLTISGQFVGSPAYAAPEAIGEGQFTPASDVYGLAATLYEALSGDAPHGKKRSFVSLVVEAQTNDPRPIDQLNPDVPPDLAAAIMASLARDPARRPSAAGLAEALAMPGMPIASPVLVPAVRPPPPVWRRGAVWLGAGAMAGLVALGVVLGGGGGSAQSTPASSGFEAEEEEDRDESRDEQREKRWRKVDDKLRTGDLRKAEDELRKLIEENPEDYEARALYQRVQAERYRYGDPRDDE